MFDFLSIYFPIADVSVNIIGLIVVGILTGTVSAIFGLGGGFIMIPYLTAIGLPISTAISTSVNQMTAGTFASFLSFARLKRIDYKMSSFLIFGGIAGSILGYFILNFLEMHGLAGGTLKVIFTILLICVSISAAYDSIKLLINRHNGKYQIIQSACKLCQYLPLKTKFPSSSHNISPIIISLIGMVGGILVILLGIGGGFIMVPLLLYGLRVNEKFLSGTIQLQIFFTSIISTFIHSVSFNKSDIFLAFYLIIGTIIGARLGSNLSTRFKSDDFRIGLALFLITIAIIMAKNTFFPNETNFIIKTE